MQKKVEIIAHTEHDDYILKMFTMDSNKFGAKNFMEYFKKVYVQFLDSEEFKEMECMENDNKARAMNAFYHQEHDRLKAEGKTEEAIIVLSKKQPLK